jgi:hypothetical protein
MIADYNSSIIRALCRRTHGNAIQRYFWLDAMSRMDRRGRWDKSVLCEPPDGNWRHITPK